MGDFNEILGLSDKVGGVTRRESQMNQFRQAIAESSLNPLDYAGPRFTWKYSSHSDTIEERLDWALVNEDWNVNFPEARLTHLDFFGSDHRVLSLEFGLSPVPSSNSCKKRKRFRYEALWKDDSECQHIIANSWLPTSEFSALDTAITNIASCAKSLDSWHLGKYGALPKEIRNTKQKLSLAQNMDHNLYNREEVAQLESSLSSLLEKEEIFWQQRSRVQWLKAGDQNTKYFHRHANTRFQNNLIRGLFNSEGIWCTDPMDIQVIIESYYTFLFMSSYPSEAEIEAVLSVVQCRVTPEMNNSFLLPFTENEVKEAVFSMPSDKSPGEDGMNGMFYQNHWNDVGDVVIKAVLECLNGQGDLFSINSTIVTLVPKTKAANNMKDFRPISLCNVLYKIVSTVLVRRLQPWLDSIVHSSQSAFIRGRRITDNAMVAYELLHNLESIMLMIEWSGIF
ncbi:hypothetical protein CsatA_015284 [Cannabis sativa]